MLYKIALAGNPNVGKSTIFNNLTKQRQHTGNWAGKTVAKATGTYKYNNNIYEINDLPGTYSLISRSKEEYVATNYLCFNKDIDGVVVVCNATNLERSLNLTIQILELTPNVLVIVNLMDEAKRKKIDINLEELSKQLGVEVIGYAATYNKNINILKEKIEKLAQSNKKTNTSLNITYKNEIEYNLKKISNKLNCPYNKRWLSIRLLCQDKYILNTLKEKKINIAPKLIKEINNNKYSNIELEIVKTIFDKCQYICKRVVKYNEKYLTKSHKIDKIITSKIFGIPLMLFLLFIIFWITIIGSNYPSEILSKILLGFTDNLYNILNFLPIFIRNLLVYGIYKTTAWVISVMLPPMLIFFPLFTILEDIGLLPRIAFNTDSLFNKCGACGKQCLTMCMGIGCNAVGVTGTRIIDNKRERLLAIITNSFIPCNGRYPTIIAIISMFLIGYSKGIIASTKVALILVLVLLTSIYITFITCKLLTKTIFKGENIPFILELPDYRKIRISKIIITSLLDRTIFVLSRAIIVAIPAGIITYLLTNITYHNQSIIIYLSNILNYPGKLIGLDGIILLAFILGLPANEIVLPIMLMIYLNTNTLTNYNSISSLKTILLNNNWTILTAINFLIFELFHYPCGTTLLTIKKETNSNYYTFLSFIIPLLIGITLCLITTSIFKIVQTYF